MFCPASKSSSSSESPPSPSHMANMGERSPAAKSSPDSPEELSREGGSGLGEVRFGAGEVGGEGDSGGRADSGESRGVRGRDSACDGGVNSAIVGWVVLYSCRSRAAAEENCQGERRNQKSEGAAARSSRLVLQSIDERTKSCRSFALSFSQSSSSVGIVPRLPFLSYSNLTSSPLPLFAESSPPCRLSVRWKRCKWQTRDARLDSNMPPSSRAPR